MNKKIQKGEKFNSILSGFIILFLIGGLLGFFIVSASINRKRTIQVPEKYKDYSVLSEKFIDLDKKGKQDKLAVLSNIPAKFTLGETKFILMRDDENFLELPDEGGELQWWDICDFNENNKTDIAVLYGYSGSAGFGQFYIYEWSGENFETIFSREEIGSKVSFRDLNQDNIKEMLYDFYPSKWEKSRREIYSWDNIEEKYKLYSLSSR